MSKKGEKAVLREISELISKALNLAFSIDCEEIRDLLSDLDFILCDLISEETDD